MALAVLLGAVTVACSIPVDASAAISPSQGRLTGTPAVAPPSPPTPPATIAARTPATRLGTRLRAPLPVPVGRRLHVSPSGSDSASGSAAAPLRTIQRGADLARPGDTVLVRAGVYEKSLRITRSGTAERPIVIRTAPGERATIRAGRGREDNIGITFFESQFVRFQGFTVEGSTGPSSANVYSNGSHSIEISDCVVRGAERQGIYVDDRSSGVQVLRCRIHDNGSTPGSQLEHGIYLQGRDHLIASSLITDHAHGFGVQVYPTSSGVIVVGNTIVRNRVGILIGGEDSTGASGTTIANNILAFNEKGIRTYWGGPPGTDNNAYANIAYANRAGSFADAGDGISYSANRTLNPRFVDAAGGDFRLAPRSPARDAAVRAFATSRDLTGAHRVAGDRPDLGALEAR